MAINKNFVIKNGVQVATDLIVGDSDTKKVGIGTTIAGYTLHVGATNIGGRGGIGATDAVITGVGTVKDLLVTGYSGFSSDVSVSGIVSAQSFGIGTTEIIDRGMRLSGIASLDAVTTATIEEAIRVGPNSFSDLKVSGISTFVGIATFATGLNVVSGVSTFGAPLRIGFAGTTDHAGVALGATVGFGTSAFFQDGAAIYFGDDSDLKIFHDSSNSFIQDLGTGNLYVDSNSLQIRNATGTETQATFTENGAVSLFYDNGNVVQTTPQGINVSGVTTSNRLNISGVSTFTSIGSNLIPDTDGSRNIGAAGSEWQDLFIDGTAKIDALEADTAKIGDLTDNRVVISGTSGELEDDANFTFDGSKLNVGSGVATVFVTTGNAAFAGIVTTGGALLVGAGATISGDILPDADGSRDLGSATLEFQDLFIDGTANIDSLAADTAAIGDLTDNRVVIAGTSGELEDDANLTFDGSKLNIGSGVATVFVTTGNVAFAGIATVGGALLVGAGATINGDLSIPDKITHNGDLNTAIRFPAADNISFETAGTERLLFMDDGNIKINGDQSGNNRAVVYNNTNGLALFASSHSGTDRDFLFYSNITGGSQVVKIASDGIHVGSSSTIAVNGNAAFAGIVTIGGDLNVVGDIVYDEITGRNLNITGISTQAGQANFGASGVGATIAANGNASFSGIVTATQFQGGGVGVGIGSTTGLVGYGFTFIQFQGPGITTVYADARPGFTGLATVFIQGGGGGVGAAGTWTPEGSIGVSTSKSVGVNTTALNDPDVQGIGNSFQGLYIGNGMLMNDNALNGNHYIGTAFGGMMAGPVTINGVLTVDGSYVVV